MKASELRIGNWIRFAEDGTDCTVTEISPTGCYVQFQSEHTWIEATEFEGIPITIKWLLDFGFVTPIRRHGVYIKGRLQIYGIMSYLIEEDTLRAHFIPHKLEYVHQLQNLYFALTGEELALDLAKQTDKK